MGRPKAAKPRSETIVVRVTAEERQEIVTLAQDRGCSGVSDLLRQLHRDAVAAANGTTNGKLPARSRSPPPSSLLGWFCARAAVVSG